MRKKIVLPLNLDFVNPTVNALSQQIVDVRITGPAAWVLKLAPQISTVSEGV
jgi:hypothetical protein